MEIYIMKQIIYVLGEHGSGKTCVIHQLIGHGFSPSYDKTPNQFHATSKYDIYEVNEYSIFKNPPENAVVIYCIDLSKELDIRKIQNIESKLAEIRIANPNQPIILLGTKHDKADKDIIDRFHSMTYNKIDTLMTSAKTQFGFSNKGKLAPKTITLDEVLTSDRYTYFDYEFIDTDTLTKKILDDHFTLSGIQAQLESLLTALPDRPTVVSHPTMFVHTKGNKYTPLVEEITSLLGSPAIESLQKKLSKTIQNMDRMYKANDPQWTETRDLLIKILLDPQRFAVDPTTPAPATKNAY